MGPIVDHTKEHLAPSDVMISRAPSRPVSMTPKCSLGRAGSFYADDKIDWQDAYQQQLKTAIRWPAPGQQAAE
jgi:phthalate 4,5-dioxygenase oxygenase subunit